MQWLTESERGALEHFMENSDALLLASLQDGSVLWANESFRQFIGYNSYDLYGDDNSSKVLWTEFSVADKGLEADVAMINELIEGRVSHYDTVKYYRPRSKAPVLCKISVVRYPSIGDMRACLVTVTPIEDGAHMAMQEMMSRTEEFVTALHSLQEAYQRENDKSELEGILGYLAKLALKYPKVSTVIILFFVVRIMGPEVLATLQTIRHFLAGIAPAAGGG